MKKYECSADSWGTEGHLDCQNIASLFLSSVVPKDRVEEFLPVVKLIHKEPNFHALISNTCSANFDGHNYALRIFEGSLFVDIEKPFRIFGKTSRD